ncbi:DUF3667 domain-containing protein [Maribacter sp. PR1]|uniref:DUF3667 domain-containing protein n=1 Tax=Maribacter cobaltidurans TaxID=1178778 RepID=A0ABU7IPC3_9FLAO|nr:MULTISPECIES: DUF3667 domain-containing protein [Maribacter]MDC6387420.1 DUF3667 domain-containing protein [Maribacter sp. PR1]MEE1974807.1 DUF3667 domain-containing protein [Maribacter cobaltidurans]
MPTTEQCKNCERTFDTDYEYCPYCGMEATDNLTVGVLFSNTIENYFSIDARFFRSFVTLMVKPGVLARRFVDGKRLKYLHPAQFYLFISVVFFFVFSFSVRQADNEVSEAIKKGLEQEINIDSIAVNVDSLDMAEAKVALKKNQKIVGMSDEKLMELDSVMSSDSGVPNISLGFKRKLLDSLIAVGAPLDQKLEAMGMDKDTNAFGRRFYAQMLKFYEKQGGGIVQVLYDTIPIAMFLLLPLFAVFLKIFYWKPATFAHHLVFSFYFFTFIFTSFCVMLLVNKVWEIPIWIEVLICFSFILYLIIALRNFYRSSWLGAFFKANIISFLYMSIIVPVAAIGIIMVAFMLY